MTPERLSHVRGFSQFPSQFPSTISSSYSRFQQVRLRQLLTAIILSPDEGQNIFSSRNRVIYITSEISHNPEHTLRTCDRFQKERDILFGTPGYQTPQDDQKNYTIFP